jgi:hypothetical protein
MKLYHGSKDADLETLARRQAQAGDNVEVPGHELKKAVYLTPSYEYALAMAARPDGLTNINESPRTITFENPEAFDPEEDVYIYEVDVPEGELTKNSDLEYTVDGDYEIKPTNIFHHKAIDVVQYYELLNWKSEKPESAEPQFKMR